jgi:hypothetical protein
LSRLAPPAGVPALRLTQREPGPPCPVAHENLGEDVPDELISLIEQSVNRSTARTAK